MRVRIVAIGRARSGPEATLVQDYLTRFDRIGRGLGLGPSEVIELEARRGGQAEEAALVLGALKTTDPVLALDERGQTFRSPQFARKLETLRDGGSRDLTFVIGGADGLTEAVRDRATGLLSFGSMVWPHMLVRVMLAEQLYRAASILSGAPYHRE